jgi:hypothetical protein
MKLKTLFITLGLLVAFATSTYADTCKSTRYALLEGTISFGMTHTEVRAALKKKYGLKVILSSIREDIFVVNFTEPQNNISKIIFRTKLGRVTRIVYTYAPSFVSSLGGGFDFAKTLLLKMKEEYGPFDDSGEDGGKITLVWNEHKGASIQVMAEERSVDVRIDCNELELELQKEQSKKANFGF